MHCMNTVDIKFDSKWELLFLKRFHRTALCLTQYDWFQQDGINNWIKQRWLA